MANARVVLTVLGIVKPELGKIEVNGSRGKDDGTRVEHLGMREEESGR